MPKWEPQVEQRPHPFGEVGVRSSLDEVCRKARAIYDNGEYLARVRTWAIDKLVNAKKKGLLTDNSERARADVLLKACQQKLWVPDPIGVEYIPGVHLLACDEHGKDGTVCVKGDDCDGINAFMISCFMAVGLYAVVIGHGYDVDGTIAHTLGGVYCEREWLRADPSAPLGKPPLLLGDCVPFTRERIYSVPNVKMLCDSRNCLDNRRFDPERLGFVTQGNFVGVNGPPTQLPDGFKWLESTIAEQAARTLHRGRLI